MYVCELTGRKRPSLGELRAMRWTDFSKYSDMVVHSSSRMNHVHWTSLQTWSSVVNVGADTAGTNGKSNCQLAGKSRSHHPASGDSGAASVDGRRRSAARGEEGEQPHHRRHLPLGFCHFPRCQGSSRGQKSAPTAVRQVGGRKTNPNRPLYWNNAPRGDALGQRGRGCCHCQRLRRAGKRPGRPGVA